MMKARPFLAGLSASASECSLLPGLLDLTGLAGLRLGALLLGLSLFGFPLGDRFQGRLGKVNLLIDVIDPVHRDEVMLSAGAEILLRKLDAVLAFQMIDGADVLAVRSQYLHVFVNLMMVHGKILLVEQNVRAILNFPRNSCIAIQLLDREQDGSEPPRFSRRLRNKTCKS